MPKKATPTAGATGATPPSEKTPIAEAVSAPKVHPRLAAMQAVQGHIEKEREGDREEDAEQRTAYLASLEDALEVDAAQNPIPDGSEDDPDTDDVAGKSENVAQPEKTVVSTDPHAPVQGDDGVWRMKVKINGTEQLVPISEAATHYQKDVAGNQKLQRAAERERQLAIRDQQLAARERAIEEQSRRASQSPQPSKDAALPSEAEEEFARAIYSGDEDTAAGAIAKYRAALTAQITSQLQSGKPAQQEVNPAQIAAEVERLISLKTARTKFDSDFADVRADQFLVELADRESERLLREEPDLSFEEHFTKAGNFARQWMKDKANAMGLVPKGEEPSPEQTRLDRKKQTASASAGTARSAAPTQKTVTPSSVIADMKRARGQMV